MSPTASTRWIGPLDDFSRGTIGPRPTWTSEFGKSVDANEHTDSGARVVEFWTGGGDGPAVNI
jgi:hypothetical protein